MSLEQATLSKLNGTVHVDLDGTGLPADSLLVAAESRGDRTIFCVVVHKTDNPEGEKAIVQIEVNGDELGPVKGQIFEPQRQFRVVS